VIALRNLTKTYVVKGVPHTVVDGANARFRSGESVALLGRNGAGKSSLLQMIAGSVLPSSGRIEIEGTVSWPVGFAGSFNGDLSGAQNVKFVARIYGIDTDGLVEFVETFAELGKHYHLPFRTYSAGMRSRLAFGVSMGIRFDTYLVDEVTSVGDAAFREKSEAMFNNRLASSGAIVVSHSMDLLRRVCTAGAVLEAGKIEMFEDVEAAIDRHQQNMHTIAAE